MSFINFIPTVWNEAIQRDLERNCVFAEDCNRQYEGAVKNRGDSVKILGVGKPTIRTLARANADADIAGPETIDDLSSTLYINQIAYFNYMVGDIDKAQAVGGIMDALNAETTEGLANVVDQYLASFVADSNVKKLYNSEPKVVNGTASSGEKNVLYILDEAIERMYDNDVSQNTKLVVTITPRFYTLFKQAYIDKATNNVQELKRGQVAMYGDVIVKMSNNVHKTNSGAYDNIMIRTQRAVAYVNPLTHTEAYRPEKKFADAVKGFILYDAKVVRPKEILNINVKYA